MPWYDYLAAFVAGMFFTNTVPHFVQGVSGNRFPTPFAHPQGRGLSSPVVNVVWALANLLVGYVLLRVGQVSPTHHASLALFFAGIAVLSIPSSIGFAKKHAA